ncbi:MAG: hypothetical protein QG640_108 [Patescibacteria group bacterium]|nr:hypothetical protein [Patescibacteria group bacterium]
MNKKNNFKYIVLAALIAFIPSTASAATVYLEASRNSVSVGDTFIISAKINSENTVINTVEGDIGFKSAAGVSVVKEFSLAGSAFGLWPRTPSLSQDEQTISFVGGVPGGFNIEGATLFRIIVEAKKEGSITINPQNIVAYANDGSGTKLPVTLKNLVVNVGPKAASVQDEWSTIIASDTTPPEDFVIVLGQDNSLFDGKKFAFFSAVDNQSGISHYDVSESGMPAVRSGSTYVLKDQGDEAKLAVTAYDKAGNKKSAEYTGVASGISWPIIIIIVLVVVIAWFIYKKWKRSKINASPAI